MKTNLLLTACEKSSKIARMFTILTLLSLSLICSIQSVYAGDAKKVNSINRPKSSLENQILRYIQLNKESVTSPEKGIVMISFSINKNKELCNVVSHSQISSLDRYLESCLQSKTVEVENGMVNTSKKQYIKIRFNIDA